MQTLNLTDKEVELIEAVRNVSRAYPNGYTKLLLYAQQVFDELVDIN